VNPETNQVVYRARSGIIAVAGMRLVLLGPGHGFTLINTTTGHKRPFGWPSSLSGFGQVAVGTGGRNVALGFADPSFRGRQVLDVWVLDTRTERLTHVPGMPAYVALKETSMAWTNSGSLVLLARSGGRNLVAVWRRGQQRLAVRRVRLPGRSGSGSYTFAPVD
jgi:hypothetical protein